MNLQHRMILHLKTYQNIYSAICYRFVHIPNGFQKDKRYILQGRETSHFNDTGNRKFADYLKEVIQEQPQETGYFFKEYK
jgi:hypothetical protein